MYYILNSLLSKITWFKPSWLSAFYCRALDMLSSRCEMCVPRGEVFVDSTECEMYQRRVGCHACDRIGCFRRNLSCQFFNRHRDTHADGGLGDRIPHMSQTDIQNLRDGALLEARRPLAPLWWRGHSVIVRIEGMDCIMGAASGDGCNCLIDTLRQCLRLVCNLEYVRQLLEQRHQGTRSQIVPRDY